MKTNDFSHIVTMVTCSCGNTFESRSTRGGLLKIEVCAKCHPFYTGVQKSHNSMQNIERFNQRYAKK